MTKRIRVVAEPHDPVSVYRLVRLLIAQAQLELNREQLKQGQSQSAATEEESG